MLMSIDGAFNNMGYSIFDKGNIQGLGLIEGKKFSDGNFKRKTDERVDIALHIAGEIKRVVNEYQIKGIIAEIPAGSQNATAANMLGWASGIIITSARMLELPFEYVLQRDVKISTVGRENASKDEIMDLVAMKMFWEVERKESKAIKEGKRKGQTSKSALYCTPWGNYSKTSFEHIADSIGVYWASRDRNLVRMFG